MSGTRQNPPRLVHSSNLQFIKLLAALLVILRHGMILLGDHTPLPGWRLEPVGIWVFFVVSGYLIPGAWVRSPGFFPYVFARLRRLTPALIVVVLAAAFLLGPLVTPLSPAEYFAHSQTWGYLLNILYYPHYVLPLVFAENPYPSAVNGSLWSLPPQLLCYLLVPLLFLVRRKQLRVALWIALFVVLEILLLTDRGTGVIVWGSQLNQAASVMVFFVAGVLLKELNVKRSVAIAAVSIALGVALVVAVPSMKELIVPLVVAYAIVSVSMASWPGLRLVNKIPDLSYGVFLLGFPIQQYLVWALPDLNGWLSIGSVMILSVLGAAIIERFVERPSAKIALGWTHSGQTMAKRRAIRGA